MRRRLLALVFTAVALAVVATASAARSFRITEAQSSFPERAYVLSLPERMHLHSGQVRVLENGQPVPDLEVVASTTASTKQFGVVLVIDASQSMEGKPEQAEIFAEGLNRIDPDIRISQYLGQRGNRSFRRIFAHGA